MVREVLGKCPVCGSDTEVTRISCDNCGTQIEGEFQLCKFCRLTADQRNFLDAFIKCRGNIKEVEKELGISYPTVKNKLDDVAVALGYKSDSPVEDTDNRRDALDKLNNGEISVEEALDMLKD